MHGNGCRTIAAALSGCWPEPIMAGAKGIGVTKPELDRYLAGEAALDDRQLSRLTRRLGLKYDDACTLRDGSHPVMSIQHDVLIAGNAKEHVLDAYRLLPGNGGWASVD